MPVSTYQLTVAIERETRSRATRIHLPILGEVEFDMGGRDDLIDDLIAAVLGDAKAQIEARPHAGRVRDG